VDKGTPKTLSGAIGNGLEHYTAVPEERFGQEVEAIRRHVKDFLAQKFQAAKCLAHRGKFNTEADVQLLFDACTSVNPPPVYKE